VQETQKQPKKGTSMSKQKNRVRTLQAQISILNYSREMLGRSIEVTYHSGEVHPWLLIEGMISIHWCVCSSVWKAFLHREAGKPFLFMRDNIEEMLPLTMDALPR
jgi:hypothetical protein